MKYAFSALAICFAVLFVADGHASDLLMVFVNIFWAAQAAGLLRRNLWVDLPITASIGAVVIGGMFV